jgi:hypothetical protein
MALATMNDVTLVNERVDVVAVYRRHGDVKLLCFPHKMKFRNQELLFTELALRHPTHQGKRMIHVFDMYDGNNSYRLEFDAEALIWTLIYIMEGSSELRA